MRSLTSTIVSFSCVDNHFYFDVLNFNSQFLHNKNAAKPNSNMVREKIDTIEDGADEQMLAIDGEKEKLALKDEGVQFISAGGDQQNGKAKVNIGKVVDKVRHFCFYIYIYISKSIYRLALYHLDIICIQFICGSDISFVKKTFDLIVIIAKKKKKSIKHETGRN